jgi:hypothetical protein
MIDIGEIRKIIDERTKIGTISRDYGHHVDDELIITNAYELTLIDNSINELERLQEKEKPMKVTSERECRSDWYAEWRKTPCCDSTANTTMNYCPNCGQKLDWSESK